jgi:hypothetical protein
MALDSIEITREVICPSGARRKCSPDERSDIRGQKDTRMSLRSCGLQSHTNDARR